PDHAACTDAVKESEKHVQSLLDLSGERTVDDIHRELGEVLWDHCGMSRNEEGLKTAQARIPELREEFWKNAKCVGKADDLNQALEYAGRVADFLECAESMVEDALQRTESCGCHFREESQTEDNEALRDDENFSYVAAWEFKGAGEKPELHKEELTFDAVTPSTRSYK
ncbi:MAG: fumarate reductase/succinate dehydrogenase flavoprotein subunit, partial [Planctomycetota bacterium]